MSVPYYPGSLYTPNLGLALYSVDSIIAENFVILDTAYGAGSSIFVNGTLVESPNLSSTTPAAPGGQELVTFQYDSNGNISAYVPIPAAGGVTSFTGDSVVYNNAASTGAVSLSLIAQAKNTVLAGPTTGANATPTFRALVAGDLPSSALINPMTTLGDIIYGGASGTPTRLAGNTTTPREFLTSAGISSAATAPTWSALVSGDIPNNAANTTGTAANLSGTPALPNGTTATTQVATDATTLIATDAFVQNAIDAAAPLLGIPWFNLIDALDYNQVVPWYNNGSPFAIDTGISRISAGVLGIGTGAQGSVAGGLELNTLQILDSGANVDLLLKNTTAATALTTNASPLLELAVFYDNGGVFTGLDTWSVGSSIAAGSNGASKLTLTHNGSTGLPQISHNSSSFVSTYVGTHTMGSTGGTCTIESGSGSTLQFQPAGTLTHALFGTYMHLANISIGWQPGTTISGNNVDINIARISPAVLGVGIQETSAPLAVAGGVGGSIQATGFYSFGGLVLEQAPSVVGTPTITPTGGSATHYSYEVVALDINMQPIGASAAGSTTTGVATLTTSAFNTVTWTAVQGAFAYAVYRSASSGTPSTTGLLYGSTTLTSVAIATAGYSATYSYASTAINAKLTGQYVLVQGAANAANSGLFYCLSATATSCVLINPYAVAEASSPASATLSSGYVPAIPSGGAALTALTFVDYGWSADGTTAPTANSHGGISWLSTYESSATGPALSLDRWSMYQTVASGLNGQSTMVLAHTGSSGISQVNINGVTPILQFENTSSSAPTAQVRFAGSAGTLWWGFGSHEYSSTDDFEIFGGSASSISNSVLVITHSTGYCGIGIGNTAPSATLEVYNALASTGATQLLVQGGAAAADATTNALLRVNQGGGTTAVFEVLGSGDIVSGGNAGVTQSAESVGTLATTNGIVTTFTAVSDERLKNWVAYEGGLNEILAITPIRYRWNETGAKYSGQSTERDFIGFSAQDVRRVIPEATWISKDDYLGFDDRPVIAALVNAVKMLSEKNKALEDRLEKIEKLLEV